MKLENELSETKTQKKRLTIEELKKYKGLENLSDVEAQETIDSLETLSIVILSVYNTKILKNEKSFDEV